MAAYVELSLQFVHWVVSNIKGGDISTGHTVSSYVGSAPPHSSGLHRYCFLLLEQPRTFTEDELKAASEYFAPRGGLKAMQWAASVGMTTANVRAVKVFQGEWDESCDTAHDALGFVPPPEYRSPHQKAKHGHQ